MQILCLSSSLEIRLVGPLTVRSQNKQVNNSGRCYYFHFSLLFYLLIYNFYCLSFNVLLTLRNSRIIRDFIELLQAIHVRKINKCEWCTILWVWIFTLEWKKWEELRFGVTLLVVTSPDFGVVGLWGPCYRIAWSKSKLHASFIFVGYYIVVISSCHHRCVCLGYSDLYLLQQQQQLFGWSKLCCSFFFFFCQEASNVALRRGL